MLLRKKFDLIRNKIRQKKLQALKHVFKSFYLSRFH